MAFEILNTITSADLEKLQTLLSLISIPSQVEAVTLRLFREEYLNFIRNNRSNSYYTSVKVSLQHLNEHLGEQTPINCISLKDCETFIAIIRNNVGEGYRVYFRTIKAAFNKAVEWKYIKENHFLQIKLPKKQILAPSFIDEFQLQKITNNIKLFTIKDIVVLGFYTGMRLNELVNLRWTNVSMVDRIITVGDHDFLTKTRKQRFIPISEKVYDILQKRKVMATNISDQVEYVFAKSNGERFTGDFISKRFKTACREVSADERIHFHSLRHSFASLLVQRGVSLYIIKELLGHSSISTTEIYSHLNKESLRLAINLFNKKN